DDYYDAAWRREPGGGTVLINGIHDIDCLRMLCGEIDSVQAFAASAARAFPVEDTAAAAIRFASGALGTVTISDAVSTPWSWEWGSQENPFYPHEAQNCYLITGTKGSLAVPTLEHWWHEPGQGWGDPLTRRRHPVKPADAYVEQMRNFARVIRGEEQPIVSGAEGARTLACTLAIIESATTGRPVRIDDFLKQG
ncbi:MAG: Gfo/Idh/MocA family oxidoreductase, partial [Proteobacteria bacterium]|nr:Gfo/Idh/MocA family oxidoreductase [Pseudomonadota bacterium]